MNALITHILPKYVFDCKLQWLLNFYSINELVELIIEAVVANIAGQANTGSTNDYQDILTLARDFYIGSDLTREEKDYYYRRLDEGHFFKLLNASLYASDVGVCNHTTYIIGKFSHTKNAVLLEQVYETYYKHQNPFLCQTCLFELSWLESKKYDQYIAELETEHSVTSLFILLYLWDTNAQRGRLKKLRYDRGVIGLLPRHTTKDRVNMLSTRLLNFLLKPPARVCTQETIVIPRDVFEEAVLNHFQIPDKK